MAQGVQYKDVNLNGVLFQKGAEYVKKVKGVFCFKVKKGNETGVFVVDAKNGNGAVKFDPAGEMNFYSHYQPEKKNYNNTYKHNKRV